jgi:hypothetical protein
MSKGILIFGAFLIIMTVITVTAIKFYFPNSLETMKTEIIETSVKNGFKMEIENVSFCSPNIVRFDNIFVADVSTNVKAAAKSFELEISLFDYLNAIYRQKVKKEKIGIKDFSHSAKFKSVNFFINGKEIFSDAKANLYFEETLKTAYDLSADKIADFYFPIQGFFVNGTINGDILGINSDIKMLGGKVSVKTSHRLHHYSLRETQISLSGIK